MNKLHEWINTILIVVVLLVALVGGNQSAQVIAGVTNYDSVEAGTLAIGSGCDNEQSSCLGTTFEGIVQGSCTIWAPAATIAATSTQQIVCQSATNGSLSSSLTGVSADSVCELIMATSTNTTIGSLVVGGTSASSTAGNIVARLINLTGTTFTWTAAASSSSQWNYRCFNPQ